MHFQATLQLDGKTATGVTVPDEIITGLGAGNRPRVRATLNGYTFETTVGRMRGKFKIPVSAARREEAGLNAGDELDVELELA